jgi:heptosyltransferase III
MRILFIKPKQIGDSLILTPTLTAVKQRYPSAEIWVVLRRGCEGILQGCPHIDRLLLVSEVEKRDRSLSSLLLEIRTRIQLLRQPMDYIFELGDGHRARGLLRFTRGPKYSVRPATPLKPFAQKRFTGISSHDWSRTHRVEKDYFAVSEFLPLGLPIPALCFERSRATEWEPAKTFDQFAMMHVGCRQKANRWTTEGWIQVGRHLLEKFGALILSSGPAKEETDLAETIRAALGGNVLCTRGKTTWPEFAGLLFRARLLVCPNTAAMHLAAACQTPTVALFGPSNEDYWHPWQSSHRIVTPRGFIKDAAAEWYTRLKSRPTAAIHPDDVIQACRELHPDSG